MKFIGILICMIFFSNFAFTQYILQHKKGVEEGPNPWISYLKKNIQRIF